MITNVATWGNSLGLRIPKAIANKLGIKPGVAIELKVINHTLQIKKTAHYSLDDLLEGVTNKNIHKELHANVKPVGKELW